MKLHYIKSHSPLTLIFLLLTLLPLLHTACSTSQYSANGVCTACHVTCNSCTAATSTSCASCDSTRFKTSQSSCQCNDGYVENSPVSASCYQLSCHYSCKTCNNTATECISCESSHKRVLVSSSNSCPCLDKYYDSGSGQCSSCHYTCGKCTAGNGISQCTFCDSYSFRTLTTNQCNCNTQYYDTGAYVCAACSHVCATCSGTSSSCETCGANRGAKPTCICSDSFWDDGQSTACVACHYSCKTCSNGTSCSSCDATKKRQVSSVSPLCSCMDRYYDDGSSVEQCASCDPRCLTCLSSQICQTCKQTAFRTLNTNTNFCDCRVGYYQTSVSTELCTKCDSRCYTCSGSSTVCTSCDASKNRVLSSGKCPCKTGFWENSFVTCSVCHQSCYTCTDGSSCSGCVASTLKVVNSSGLCDCSADKYYNTTNGRCETCNYKCATCTTGDPEHCLTCALNSNSHRTLASNACPCDNHYWDSGSTNCVSCHYSCLTCSSSSSAGCLSCTAAAQRTLSINRCLCNTNYYNQASLQQCQPCLYHCLTCTNSTGCTSCDLTLHRVLTTSHPKQCNCKSYYFEVSNQTCQPCRYDCNTCSSFTTCLTCSAASHHRVFNSSTAICDCQNKYYDNFVDRVCLSCLPECLTCTNSTKCTSCDSSLKRTLSPSNRCPCEEGLFEQNGVCVGCLYHCQACNSPTVCTACNSTAERTLDSVNKLCYCRDNFFDDYSNQQCLSCSYACETCVNTAKKCLSCDTTLREFSSNWCACPQHFWDNNSTTSCEECPYTCSSCRNLSKCHTCNSTMKRVYDSSNLFCQCMEGWYDDGINQLCPICNYRCKACTNTTQCQTCNSTSFRRTPAAMCPCQDGYYDDGSSHICIKCHYTCKTCTNGSQCSSCEAPTKKRQFNNTNYLCKCQDRFYDDGTNQQCLACIYTCLTCQTTSTTCHSCNSSAYRQLTGTNCNCMDRFYDNLVEHCLPCQYTCLTCTQSNRCTSCDNVKHRQIDLGTNLCKCMDRWWDDGLREDCQACHASCRTCTDTNKCISCDSSEKRMLNSTTDLNGISSPFCVCFYRHWAASDADGCQPCHYSCEVCTAASATNCSYCNATSLRTLSATTTSCPCNDGYFDDGTNQLCQPCHQYCALCTNQYVNSCSRCNSLYYHLAAVTTCYQTCPDRYFGYQVNFTCQSCSQYCLTCINQTYCSKCETGKYLYEAACYVDCPQGTYNDNTNWICIKCPQGCRKCPNHSTCQACYDQFYYVQALNFCSSCSPACQTCSGPGISQCLTCASPLTKKSGTCISMSCPSGTYVHPTDGCSACSSLFPGSATCNASMPLSCSGQYKLINDSCVACGSVEGYKESKGECVEICGDGKLFYMQCDDGDNKNGDGCSSNCLIEKGWICSVSSPSECFLKDPITLTFERMRKISGKNQVVMYIVLSLPVKLQTGSLIFVIEGVSSSDYEVEISQHPQKLEWIQVEVTYRVSLHHREFSCSYSDSRRLLQQESGPVYPSRQLVSLSFSSSFTFDTYPPAEYYSDQTQTVFKRIRSYLTAFSIGTVILGWVLIPKKMHLHALSVLYLPAQVFIMFGMCATSKSDWIQFTVGHMWQAAMIGGWSAGPCCDIISQDQDITSEVVATVGLGLAVLVGGWILLAALSWLHKSCCGSMRRLVGYFVLTVTFGLFLPVVYASMNALSHFTLQTPADSFNTNIGILLSLSFPLLVVGLWVVSWQSEYEADGGMRKTINKIHIEQKDDIIPLPESEHSSQYGQSVSQKGQTFYKSEMKTGLNFKSNQYDMDGLLPYDYLSLYCHTKGGWVEGRRAKLPTTAKYYLPLHVTKLYLIAILASLMQGTPFPFFLIAALLQLAFLLYLIAVRPFLSAFTNLRLIVASLLLLTAQVSFSIYLYYSIIDTYKIIYEKITAYTLLILMGIVMGLLIVQHVLMWRKQIWQILQPCLKGSRLMGTRKMAQFDIAASSDQMSRTLMKSTKGSFFNQNKRQQQEQLQSEQIDAFYARMLKRDELNRRYRKQRHIR